MALNPPTFADDNYDSVLWNIINGPATFADDLFNSGAALDGGGGSNVYAQLAAGGIAVSGDTAITTAAWFNAGDMTAAVAHGIMMGQLDSSISGQFLFRVLKGAVDHGQVQLILIDGGTSATSLSSKSNERFDDDTDYLLIGTGNGTNVKMYFASVANQTLQEVTYAQQDAGSFTAMGGATADLLCGEDLDTPAGDQLVGKNSRPRIWKNSAEIIADLQDWADTQFALLATGPTEEQIRRSKLLLGVAPRS